MANARAARLVGEQALGANSKRPGSLKQEQDREYNAMLMKTARLRALRLAKEAADQNSAATPDRPSPRSGAKHAKRRRQS
jgi:hypothetical protein